MSKYRIKVEETYDGIVEYIPQYKKNIFGWKCFYTNDGARFSCSTKEAAERFIKSFKIKSTEYIDV